MIPSILAIIPAKLDSRRLPGKNLLPVGGVPMYQRTQLLAEAAGCFERIIVSSDHELPLIDGVAMHVRPVSLCGDVPSIDVAKSILNEWFIEAGNWLPEWTCLLQPTSPVLRDSTLAYAARLCADDVDAVIAGHNPIYVEPISNLRKPCGAFYFVRSYILASLNLPFAMALQKWDSENRVSWVPVPDDESVDVDTHNDWVKADLIAQAREE